jgi:hypothetical protein
MSTETGEDDLAKAPQQLLDDFWEGLITKKPGKITNICRYMRGCNVTILPLTC